MLRTKQDGRFVMAEKSTTILIFLRICISIFKGRSNICSSFLCRSKLFEAISGRNFKTKIPYNAGKVKMAGAHMSYRGATGSARSRMILRRVGLGLAISGAYSPLKD